MQQAYKQACTSQRCKLPQTRVHTSMYISQMQQAYKQPCTSHGCELPQTRIYPTMYISRMQTTTNTHIPNHELLTDANYHKHAYTQACAPHKHTLTSAINLAKTFVALSYCKPSSHIAWTQSVILCLLIGKFRPREVDIDIFITASTVAITGSPSR